VLRFWIGVLVFFAPLRAQFFGLATPGDGSLVYFGTPLRQKNTNQPTWGKLFQADASGIRLRETRDYIVPDPPPSGVATGIGLAHPTNPYDIVGGSTSSDGSVLAVTGWRDCVSGGSYCSKMEHWYTTITAAGKSAEYPGWLRLSPNGEWAFGNTEHVSYDESRYSGHYVNLKTGVDIGVPIGGWAFAVSETGRLIANDGTAVYTYNSEVTIRRGNETTTLTAPNGDSAADPVIDASGRRIVYAAFRMTQTYAGQQAPGPRYLCAADAVSHESRVLTTEGDAPSLSEDGATVLYLSRSSGLPQLRVIGFDGRNDRALPADPAGIVRAVLSGDGRTVYAVTRSARLIRISVTSGQVTEIVPRTPVFGGVQTGRAMAAFVEFAPGAVASIPGYGFAPGTLSAAPPLPEALGGVRVSIQGRPVKILAVSPTLIRILAPPELTPTPGPNPSVTYAVELDSASPFESPASATASFFASGARFLTLEDPDGDFGFTILSAHEDWSGLVTPDSPARPGEILHSYAVGLGATTPAVAYGDPAPDTEPLARVATRYQCAYRPDQTTPLEVPYQGLAPGLAGYYQIDWRVPAGAGTGALVVVCNAPSSPTGFVGGIPVRARE
jgi:uncharacterized protein (TIGR03437 family)